ncbi:hypothetical protein PIB30_088980 [Stylosanthes scabra]|uniref:Uncharacterized protein n=1 Tax=Stylosanthes scabra TaxID=79078 RepID=A0ABU6SU86_9FABA|nr:hypothetical protein [Stylosanthes scabra]
MAESSSEVPRFKTLYHEAHFKSKLSARKVLPELAIDYNDGILSPCAMQIKMRKWENLTAPLPAVGYNLVKEFYANAWEPDKAKRKPYTYTTMLLMKRERPTKIIGLKRCWNASASKEESGSIMPTTNCSELTVERVVLIHSIIIGENINVEEIIANQIYKFVYKTDTSSSLLFPSIIAAFCLDAKVVPHKDDTMIPQETPIAGEAMVRTRETRPRQPRQEVPPPQQPPQVHQQQELPPNFYTHFDASMSQIYRRLDQQQEESRKSFEAINSRMDRMDDQLGFLCYSNQMSNEQMLFPYQNTASQFKEMEMQGIPVTMANLAIHRQREEEMNQERMRYDQIFQEAAAQQAREANKGKAREVVPDSEEEESEEMYSSPLEEW